MGDDGSKVVFGFGRSKRQYLACVFSTKCNLSSRSSLSLFRAERGKTVIFSAVDDLHPKQVISKTADLFGTHGRWHSVRHFLSKETAERHDACTGDELDLPGLGIPGLIGIRIREFQKTTQGLPDSSEEFHDRISIAASAMARWRTAG